MQSVVKIIAMSDFSSVNGGFTEEKAMMQAIEDSERLEKAEEAAMLKLIEECESLAKEEEEEKAKEEKERREQEEFEKMQQELEDYDEMEQEQEDREKREATVSKDANKADNEFKETKDDEKDVRIYVSSVPANMDETDLKTIAERFGEVSFVKLLDSSVPSGHRAGFFDMCSVRAAMGAIKFINNMARSFVSASGYVTTFKG